jgi:hypothetical protein
MDVRICKSYPLLNGYPLAKWPGCPPFRSFAIRHADCLAVLLSRPPRAVYYPRPLVAVCCACPLSLVGFFSLYSKFQYESS